MMCLVMYCDNLQLFYIYIQSLQLTGIHWAADSGSLEVCRYLLGVDPSLIGELDTEGNEPMHLGERIMKTNKL